MSRLEIHKRNLGVARARRDEKLARMNRQSDTYRALVGYAVADLGRTGLTMVQVKEMYAALSKVERSSLNAFLFDRRKTLQEISMSSSKRLENSELTITQKATIETEKMNANTGLKTLENTMRDLGLIEEPPKKGDGDISG